MDLRELASHYLGLALAAWGHLKRSYLFWAGFIILAAFCLISIVGPPLTRDPIDWHAPEEDLLEVDMYWEMDTSEPSYGGAGETNFSVAVRLKPAAIDIRADRVYLASGGNLIAADPSTGGMVWRDTSGMPSQDTCCFAVDSEISAAPVAVNFGRIDDLATEEQYVVVGTSQGTLYILREERLPVPNEDMSPLPEGSNVITIDLGGPVSSVAAYSDGQMGISLSDRVFAGTSLGMLYALSPNGTVLWSRSLGSQPILMANLFPTRMRMTSSSCTEASGSRLFVNDGNLRALWTENGTDVWTNLPGAIFPMGSSWSSPPYLASYASPYGELICAGSDEGTLHVVFPRNGTALFSKYLDDGRLTTPTEGGNYILVGSSTGTVYTVHRDQIRDIPAGQIRGKFRMEGEPTTPIYSLGSQTYYVGDSEGYVACVHLDGNYSFRSRFEGRIQGHPMIWGDQHGSGHLWPLLFITNSPGMVHALSSTGLYLAPLPPGCYSSGNCYALGTDNQGRDIFSQLIAGFSIVWITILVAILTVVLGTFLGTLSGYLDGWWTFFIMLLVNVCLALPILVLAMVLVSVMGMPWISHPDILIALVLILSAPVAKLIDVETRELKGSLLFVNLGSGMRRRDHYIRTIFPRMLARGASYSKVFVPTFILVILGLEFVGLGDVNTPSWGMMLQLIQWSNVLDSWWWLVLPGICTLLLGLSIGLIAQSFEELANRLYREALGREEAPEYPTVFEEESLEEAEVESWDDLPDEISPEEDDNA